MRLHLPALAAFALAFAMPADAAERSFTVSGFDKIRVDGPYRVKLRTGVATYARASGSQAALDAVSLEVQGRTLVVRTNRSAWTGDSRRTTGPVEIEVGAHELSAAWLNGSGALIVDRVRRFSFELWLHGSASAAVGSLAVDLLKVGLSGTASAVLAGTSALVSASIRGASSLDASGLTAKDATLGAEGAAMVKLRATGTAKINAHGPATVILTGGAACIVKADGTAEVIGCR